MHLGRIVARSRSFFAELQRRNVVRAALLYAGAVWAISQGIAQLSPALNLPGWTTRAFLIATALGFPFWLAFAWIYELTPHGLKRESEIAPGESIARRTGRKLDFVIIAVLTVAVLLLLGNQFLWHKGIAQSASPASTAAAIPALAIPAESVAVLPFTNESGNKDEQFFSDGLSEDLINALSQFGGLKVIGRNSAFRFRDSNDDAKTIGGKLGVAHLLEGSVQRTGDVVRISATLVIAADGSALWSRQYDRPYKDLFSLQDEITRSVADALKAKLLIVPGAVVQSDKPPGGNLDAYDAFLRGNFADVHGTEAEYRRAIGFYESALRIDPDYAQAQAMLSLAWLNLARKFLGGDAARDAFANARRAADAAIAITPGLAVAHSVRGALLLAPAFDWNGALQEYRRAAELAPNDDSVASGLADVVAALGRSGETIAPLRRQIERDPYCASCNSRLALYLASLGELDAADQAMRKAIELQPGHADRYTFLTMIAILRGDAKGALQAANEEVADGGWKDIALAFALQVGTDRAAADAALKHLIATQADPAAFQIAEIYGLRRDPDNMFLWLDRAWSNRDPGLEGLLYDGFILRYRDDPRFAAFCRKVGLPATTDAVAMK